MPKKRTWMACVSVAALGVATMTSAEASAQRWLDSEVVLDLEIAGGSDRVFRMGEPVRLSLRVDADAYVAVYAIDAAGTVRWLFPRFWEDDGMVQAGHRVRLQERGLASGLEPGDEGIMFVQALASPVPFDWRGLGVRECRGEATWLRDGAPLRVQGDPLDGFNEINRLLFPCWDEAVFVTDTAAFHRGRRFEHPTYLCGVCAGRHRGYHDAWVQVRADFGWELQRGRNFARRIHRPQYVYCAERRALGHRTTRTQGAIHTRAVVRSEARSRDGRIEAAARVKEMAAAAVRVAVPRRGATPPEPDSDARSGGRRFRQAEPAVSGGARPIEPHAKIVLAQGADPKRKR